MAGTELSAGSRIRARDSNPESVIFTLESNFSVSSTSASVERCSFASDAHDSDCQTQTSDFSPHLEGNSDEYKEGTSGPGQDPDHNASKGKKHNRLPGNRERVRVEKEDTYVDAMDGYQPLDMARNFFSLALIECRDRKTRSEALLNKADRQRPASLDPNNNVTVSSPRLGVMKKSSLSPQVSGIISMSQSPATTSCSGPVKAEIQKGWNSERVPLHNNASLKHASPAFLSFNNGRTLPSKWEDAERWIISPVSKNATIRPSVPPPQRRPKSKSGPLGFPGIANNSMYSPEMSMLEGSKLENFMASPFSAGVIAEDGLAIRFSGYEADNPVQTQPCIARSVSVHGCSQMASETSQNTSGDQDLDGIMIKDSDTNISCDILRRDMATQMSPANSSKSSLEIRPPISIFTPAHAIQELKSLPRSKLEVKDVEVDGRVTMTRWSKKHKTWVPSKGQVLDKDAESVIRAWDQSDITRSISKVMREEAKITAWENLQKAKAEAAIRKLEMKLERKRSSSMDRIMSKLKSAQRRAQEMRNSMLPNKACQVDRSSHKAVSSSGKAPQRTSFSGCFTCQAF